VAFTNLVEQLTARVRGEPPPPALEIVERGKVNYRIVLREVRG
jgi:hypothetical protein